MFLKIKVILLILLPTISLNSATLFVYLNIENHTAQEKRLILQKLSFVSSSDKTYSFKLKNKLIFTKKFNSQFFIKKVQLPEGAYKKIILHLKKTELEIPFFQKVKKKEFRALFIVWDVKNSSLFIKNQSIPLRGELLFATSKKDNALFFIRIDKNQVCAVMKIKGSPTEINLSCLNDKIYILTQNSKAIKVIEVSSFKETDSFALPFVQYPSMMVKTPNYLIAVDSALNRIVSVRKNDGTFIKEREIGEKISDIAYWEKGRKILISSLNEQTIYIADEDTFDISSTIKLDCAPTSLFVLDNYLYISQSSCNTMIKYNLLTREFEKKYNIISPFRMKKLFSTLYITSKDLKCIYILPESQLSFTSQIPLSIAPERISVSSERGWIYISGENSDKIEVIDLNSEISQGIIETGSKIYDIKIGRLNECLQ